MTLTAENYYTQEANRAYYSASQIKAFYDCPAMAMAELNGEYARPISTALLVGGYVDAHFAGELDEYRQEHPEIFTKTGLLRSDYLQADAIIDRIEQDALAMALMGGDKQKIITGEIGGKPFKAKMDLWLDGEKARALSRDYDLPDLAFAEGAIVDLKIMKDFEPLYKKGEGRLNFIEFFRYDLQLAIYRDLIRQQIGVEVPCYILAATKQNPPDIGLYKVPEFNMGYALEHLKAHIEEIDRIKRGEDVPERCEGCAYCRATKRLTGAGWFEEWE